MTAMLTTAGLTLSMTSANETAAVAGARGAAGCAVRPPVTFMNEKASTPAPTAPATQPTRAEFLLHCSVIASLRKAGFMTGQFSGDALTSISTVPYGFVMKASKPHESLSLHS